MTVNYRPREPQGTQSEVKGDRFSSNFPKPTPILTDFPTPIQAQISPRRPLENGGANALPRRGRPRGENRIEEWRGDVERQLFQTPQKRAHWPKQQFH
jgi:hypothetical protein